jgi:hypothetical protein
MVVPNIFVMFGVSDNGLPVGRAASGERRDEQ